MRALAPRRIGPSISSTDVNDDAHTGHCSTSVKTDHTTWIGASIVIDARSALEFLILHLFPLPSILPQPRAVTFDQTQACTPSRSRRSATSSDDHSNIFDTAPRSGSSRRLPGPHRMQV